MPEPALARYRESWERVHRERLAACERRRHQALEAARALAAILVEEFGAERVVLFGSVLEAERFREDSDIDLAVEGLPPERTFEALGRLLQEGPFAVDLVPVEDARASLRERIARGTVLHEEGTTA